MRRFGQLLAGLGLVLGVLLGLSLLVPVHFTGLAWLAALGAFKLVLASSLGLIAGGAVLQRVGKAREARELEFAARDDARAIDDGKTPLR